MSRPILPPERAGIPAPADLAARRAGLAAMLAAADLSANQVVLAGVRCLRFDPTNGASAAVLHLHGGAFRIGCPEQVAGFAAALASRCGVTVICPAYRLAPEYPFPAGLTDAHAVWTALRADGSAPIILSGDSAGGGLATSLAQLIRHDPMPPAGLVLLSAWLDLRVTADSYRRYATHDRLFSADAARDAAAIYLQGRSADDPLASPLFGPLDAFPPTLINCGAEEVLVDDARLFAAGLNAAGARVRLDLVPGMSHVAVTRDQALPGAAHSFDSVATFIDALLP